MSRILAIDYGRRRVGLALSDPTRTLATGLSTLERRSGTRLPDEIERLVVEHGVARVIVGHPLGPDGASGARAREVERFAEELRGRLAVPVILRDERETTVRAWEALRKRGTKTRKGKAQVDRVAAAILLQDYLDSGASPAEPGEER